MNDTNDPIRNSLSSALETAADALAEWLVEKAKSRAKYRMYIEAGKPALPDQEPESPPSLPIPPQVKAEAEAVKQVAPTWRPVQVKRKPPVKKPDPNSKQQRAMALIRAGATDSQVYAGVPGLKPAHLSVCKSLVRRKG